MAMITVWGRRNSVNVQKVLWALEELDVPFTRENVGGSFGGNLDADFLAMNPMGLVPVIRDGDVTMFESNAIVRYLAARFRAGVLRPSEHRSLAMAEQWMEWTQLNFAPAVSTLFVNRVRSLPEDSDAVAASAAEKKAAEALTVADAWIARHDWFAGQEFSFGDIAMGALLWRYMGIDCARPQMPHLMEWFEAVQAREAFRRAVMAVPRAKDLADWNRIEKETA
jgi:glutathione S-transferase